MAVYNAHAIPELVQQLTALLPSGANGLSDELGVSTASVQRWLSGDSRPRPLVEGQLRQIAERLVDPTGAAYEQASFAWPCSDEAEELRSAFLTTCRELREAFHRRGRLSSRHEALDELAKLLFAHIMSMANGHEGIADSLRDQPDRSAFALKQFTSRAFRQFLPDTLSKEMPLADFELRLKDSEDALARDIERAFRHLQSPALVDQLRGTGSVDVLNEAFGHFLADSFVDEKELGQYLTPLEVVRFMVRLGLGSLNKQHLDLLKDPSTQREAGIILDPSCGVGSFLVEAVRLLFTDIESQHGQETATDWLKGAVEHNIVGIDKSERMLRLALTNLAMFGVAGAKLHLANALARNGNDGQIGNALDNQALLIITNPPFGAAFPFDETRDYRLASSWVRRPRQTIDSELLFLERYLDWLAPGGQLVTIVPDSILTNRGIYGELRNGILPMANIRSVVSLPSVTFAAAGTSTKTSVLHLEKRVTPGSTSSVYFFVCEDIGYQVQTRGSARTKVRIGRDQLREVLSEALRSADPHLGSLGTISEKEHRWDAGFHAGLPDEISNRLNGDGPSLKVRDVAVLSSDRLNPVRLGVDKDFPYIEISDVESASCRVSSKQVPCSTAPSRARKKVRAGDVLVSTVRPERKTVGVVPNRLDGAICTTGFAVLRSEGIHPLVLARLLQTDFVNAQLVRDNSGVAYPSIDEEILLSVTLPIDHDMLEALRGHADKVVSRYEELEQAEANLATELTAATKFWLDR